MIAADLAPAWFTSRAAGIVALLLCSASVALGLAKATGVLPTRVGGVSVRALHEALALGAMAMIGLHGASLVLDPYLKPGLAGVVVPFAAGYRPFATGLGQLAAYGIAGLGLSFYARRSLGAARWRAAHALIPAFWVLAVIHGLALGTDRGAWWFLAAIGVPAAAAVVLLAIRLDAALTRPAVAQSVRGGHEGGRGWRHDETGTGDGRSPSPAPLPSLWRPPPPQAPRCRP